ncbi:LAGLIDADG endonuclease [Fusarium oxysporum II5]|nr:LAGLIDADG endonuclease [Fusarium oxysporum II5]
MFEVSGLHSKPIFQVQSYSSLNSDSQPYTQISISKDSPRYSFNNKNTFYLNPDYLTGFVDGEVKPIFSISLHNKDIKLLEAIQRTFKIGKIYKHGVDSMQYRVSSLKNLQIITDHFDSYPLITQKRADYLLFKQAIAIIKNKEHLSMEGLSDKFKERFIDAEGSFQVITQNNRNVSLRFSLTQHIKDEKLLKDINTYLNCGRYYKSPGRNEGQYLITIFSDINDKLIPFLNEYPLLGTKLCDFLDFAKIAELIKSKAHLTDKGLEKIKLIQSNMARSSRKRITEE